MGRKKHGHTTFRYMMKRGDRWMRRALALARLCKEAGVNESRIQAILETEDKNLLDSIISGDEKNDACFRH